MKKALLCIVVVAACLSLTGFALAADKEAAKAKPAPAMPPGLAAKGMPDRPPMRANFSMLYGMVTKIDAKDPANVKLEVKNEADNTTHTVEVSPATNVTKVTEISEVKTGETVRIMARKVDNKEVAMGVMFGKVKRPRVPGPAAQRPATPAVPAQPQAAGKK